MLVAGIAGMDKNIRQVVVAYDFSEHGRAVLDRAISLVSRAPQHVLHFVTVLDGRTGIPAVPVEGTVDYQYADRVREHMATEITKALHAAEVESPEIHFFLHARIGTPAGEILDLAKEVGADLIFVGTHGYTGLKHLVMGSVAERVVREAGCPVMVVRAKTYPDITLDAIVEVPAHKTPESKLFHRFSYSNKSVVMRPPHWTIM